MVKQSIPSSVWAGATTYTTSSGTHTHQHSYRKANLFPKARYSKKVVGDHLEYLKELRKKFKNLTSTDNKFEKRMLDRFELQVESTLSTLNNKRKTDEVEFNVPKLKSIIVQSRNGYRFYSVLKLRMEVMQLSRQEYLTEEEQKKIEEAANILAEVGEKQNWNKNTKTIFNKVKI